MNNSKPRKGSGRRSVKNPGGTGSRYRIPPGFPGAGRFISRDSWELHWKEKAAELRKIERQKKDREHKAAARARRQPLMAKADGVFVTNAELREEMSGWSSASTGHLKEKTVYAWHGAFYIQGSAAAMLKAKQHAGSEVRLKILSNTMDKQYTDIIFPFFENMTPSQAEQNLPGHAEMMTAQLERQGLSVVLYLGAVWKKI